MFEKVPEHEHYLLVSDQCLNFFSVLRSYRSLFAQMLFFFFNKIHSVSYITASFSFVILAGGQSFTLRR